MTLGPLADLPQWQIALASAWILLQGCVLPAIPEEVVIVSLGALVGQGRVDAPVALAAVLVGLLPANSAAVLFGSLARRRLDGGGTLGRALSSPWVAGGAAALRRHGPIVILVTRFTPLVRGPVYLATGLSGLGAGRFFLLDAAAASVQVPLLLWIGSRVGAGATAAQAWIRIGWLSAGLVGTAIVLAAASRLLRRGAPPEEVVDRPGTPVI